MSNPLDLNNLPKDLSTDHDKQPLDLSSTQVVAAAAGRCYKKKKNGVVKQDGSGKEVYKCRFCSLTFSKSQSLGGHMNRHRQEKEEETLNMARQIVFGEDNFYQQGSNYQPRVNGGYAHHHGSGYNMGSASSSPTISLFSFGGSAMELPPAVMPPAYQHYLPSLGIPAAYSSSGVMGHVYSGNPQFIHMNRITTPLPNDPINFTCIDAQAFTVSDESGGGGSSTHANATD